MNIVNVNLLGNPTVVYQNNTIHFPYKKVEGLFYYICVNKNITREEAKNLLWIDCNEELAKKNLRDALYNIRKALGEDIFLHTQKSVISINAEMINLDVDSLNNNILDIYNGEFLSNFYIKNCDSFEQWMQEKKEEYKNIYIDKIKQLLIEMVNIKDFNRIQKYSSILMANDPYNEKNYREIMKIYALSGNYNIAIKTYFDLCKILKDDLNIEPETSTKNMYKEIIMLKDSDLDSNSKSNYFYGRFDELYHVTNSINDFYNDKSTSILISGEAGIGKTAFLNKIESLIDKNKFLLLRSDCYNAEKDFFLKPWHSIFSILGEYIKKEKITISSSAEQIISYIFPYFNKEISTTKYDSTERIDTTRFRIANEAIINLLVKITCKKKIILIFDDIQWMDDVSKMLLNSILYKLGNTNILLIATYRNDYSDIVEKFSVDLINKDLLTEITLNRFTRNEVMEIIRHQINLDNDNSIVDKIYKDTEGNALFLIELLKTIKEKGYTNELSLKATNIIKSRIIDLTMEEISVLNAISIFFDKADIETLKQIINFDELEVFEIIERLHSKYLINEIIEKDNIYYSFTHQKIRDYVYETQSIGKRQLLHKKVAVCFEDKYNSTNNSSLFSNLIYHFEKSGDVYKTLQYKIEYIKEFYTVYNETFPVISYDFHNDMYTQIANEQKLLDLYNEICKFNEMDIKVINLKMEISYIMARYYISKGEYAKGLKSSDISIGLAIKLNNTDYILQNYKQIVFYAIQVHDLEKMKIYIDKIVDITGMTDYNEEVGTILRLYGLYYIKIKEYNKAKKLLLKSIDTFNHLNNISNKYSLSIAACYNYLGMMNNYLSNYNEAYYFFIEAKNICNKNYITIGLGMFYSNAGQALYEMNRYDEAFDYITNAIEYFTKNDAMWGRDIAECYAALLEIKRNNIEKAKEHLNIAKNLGKKLANPVTLKLITKINHEINSKK